LKSRFFYGQTGSGKTWSMVKEALIDFLLGRTIYGNLQSLKLPYYYVGLEELIDMVSNEELDVNNATPKTLLLDEIHTLFDGRRSQSRANIDFSSFVSQCRKRRFNVYYTSQWVSGADTRIRTLTTELVRCIPPFDINDYGLGDASTPEPKSIEHRIVNISDLQEGNPKVKRKIYPRWKLRPIYKFYDTYEVIRPSELYA